MELNVDNFKSLIFNKQLPEKVDLTVEQVVWIETVKTLRSINAKMMFFVVLTIINILAIIFLR